MSDLVFIAPRTLPWDPAEGSGMKEGKWQDYILNFIHISVKLCCPIKNENTLHAKEYVK